MPGTKAEDRGSKVVKGNSGEGVSGGDSEFQYGLKYIGGVGSMASKVLADHLLKLLEGTRLDV